MPECAKAGNVPLHLRDGLLWPPSAAKPKMSQTTARAVAVMKSVNCGIAKFLRVSRFLGPSCRDPTPENTQDEMR